MTWIDGRHFLPIALSYFFERKVQTMGMMVAHVGPKSPEEAAKVVPTEINPQSSGGTLLADLATLHNSMASIFAQNPNPGYAELWVKMPPHSCRIDVGPSWSQEYRGRQPVRLFALAPIPRCDLIEGQSPPRGWCPCLAFKTGPPAPTGGPVSQKSYCQVMAI